MIDLRLTTYDLRPTTYDLSRLTTADQRLSVYSTCLFCTKDLGTNEMIETANILHNATPKSLILLDEVGRGTATVDGLSIARSIVEYLHNHPKVAAKTMFATHYHELTDLTTTLKHAANWNVAVQESNDDVVFLHRIVEGAAGRSYGIHVAKIAGVPRRVTERATMILATLEDEHVTPDGRPKVPQRETTRQRWLQKSLFEFPEDPLLEEIRKLEVDSLSPIQALQELYRLRQQLTDRK